LNVQGQSFTVTQAGSTTTGGGQLQWVRQSSAGTSGNARANGEAVDQLGNVVIVGVLSGTVDFGTVPISSSAVLDNDGFIAKYDAQGRALWAKRFGSTRSDIAQSVAFDRQGNIIVTGQFTGDVDFGGTTLTTGGSVNADGFVAKYDTANPPNLVWAKRFGGTALDRGWAVAVDGNNDVFLGAIISSSGADFGGISLSAAGLDDMVIAKLSAASGSTLWAKRWGGTANERPGALAVDRSGDVWVTGAFWGTSDLGSGPISASPAVNKVFLVKYSSADGSYRPGSLKTFGTSGNNSGNGVAVDPQTGNVIITGGCAGAVDFGGGPVLNAGGTEGNAIFVAAYGPSGNYLWAHELGDGFTTSAMMGSAVAVDNSGTVAITGQSSSMLNVGSQWLTGYGHFVITFDSSGAFQWAKIASGGPSAGGGIAFDPQGRIVAAGYSSGLVNFGTAPNGQDIIGTAPNGIPASFVAQYLR
jgi:hypothetical protein